MTLKQLFKNIHYQIRTWVLGKLGRLSIVEDVEFSDDAMAWIIEKSSKTEMTVNQIVTETLKEDLKKRDL